MTLSHRRTRRTSVAAAHSGEHHRDDNEEALPGIALSTRDDLGTNNMEASEAIRYETIHDALSLVDS
jgi:hypothetical protein